MSGRLYVIMLGDLVIRPTLHGALGPWDEIINLMPVVVGLVLVAYLFVSSRRRRNAGEQPPSEEKTRPDT